MPDCRSGGLAAGSGVGRATSLLSYPSLRNLLAQIALSWTGCSRCSRVRGLVNIWSGARSPRRCWFLITSCIVDRPPKEGSNPFSHIYLRHGPSHQSRVNLPRFRKHTIASQVDQVARCSKTGRLVRNPSPFFVNTIEPFICSSSPRAVNDNQDSEGNASRICQHPQSPQRDLQRVGEAL